MDPEDLPSGEEVAALLAHELRTPLTVLYSCLQLLDRNLPPDGSAEARRYLDEALAEARQLTAITGQLVDAAEIHLGSLQLSHHSLEVQALVREAIAHAQTMTRGQRIRLHAPSRPLVIQGDYNHLQRAILSLVVNAITYAPGTDRIDVLVQRLDGDVAIEVRDYGPGIQPARLEGLTRAFYQPPQMNRPSRGGLGLSLYVTREVARLHAGRLEVSSVEGQGSRFSLVLPLAAGAPRVSEPVRAPRPAPAHSPAPSAAPPGRQSAGSARH